MSTPSSATFGLHGDPGLVIAHLSDTHLLAEGAPLFGLVDTRAHLVELLDRLERVGRVDAIVVSGDVADLGEPDAYRIARALVEPVAARLGAQVIWAMGNHDERDAFARELLDTTADGPLDAVYDVDGLRIVVLDSSVPGWHHGAFDPGQSEWLRTVLSVPAPRGTVLVMHHPPLPYRQPLMRLLEFDDEAELQQILEGSDVRAVLSGHLHITSHGMFGQVPVSIANAAAYAVDLAVDPTKLLGNDASQSFNLVEVYDDTVVHSVIPVRDAPTRESLEGAFDPIAELSPDERRARFSRKPAPEPS